MIKNQADAVDAVDAQEAVVAEAHAVVPLCRNHRPKVRMLLYNLLININQDSMLGISFNFWLDGETHSAGN